MARQPAKVEIHGSKRLLDGFFKIDEVELSHELFNGQMSPKLTRLVFDRGDAVAALLFDPDRLKMILVNQFRLPTHESGRGRGWILETMAGMIKPGESPEACLMREVIEETGYQVTEYTPVATFFSSPGGSTERIFLYFAEVRQTDKVGAGGGLAADGKDVEDIDIVELPADEFYRRLQAHEFEDPKIIIAGQWFHGQLGKMKSELDKSVSRTFKFRVKGSADQIIGIKTGDILATRNVDVWVNSENTDMMMDRFFGKSVSAAIRRGGAKKMRDKPTIIEDTIGKALAAELNGRGFVAPTTVIHTGAGELLRSNNVKRIFHVATVQGAIGGGLSTTIDTIEQCIDRVLEDIHMHDKYRSVLLPLLGTGQAGQPVHEVGRRLVEHAIGFFKKCPQSSLREIYLLAYLIAEQETLMDLLRRSDQLEYLPDPANQQGFMTRA